MCNLIINSISKCSYIMYNAICVPIKSADILSLSIDRMSALFIVGYCVPTVACAITPM